MTTRVERLRGCLRPVVVDEVVADPEQVRDIARRTGPYFMPARYLIDGGSAKSASECFRYWPLGRGALGEPLAATGADALSSPALRDQLSARWSGYRAG